MKTLTILFLTIISQSISSQTKSTKAYKYKTAGGEFVSVEIDTSEYKPQGGYNGYFYKLYSKKIDAHVFIGETKININDTIQLYENLKKEFEFENIGLVNGEKTINLKSVYKIKNKDYVEFIYLKFTDQNDVLSFRVLILKKNFDAHKKEFIGYAKSMTTKN